MVSILRAESRGTAKNNALYNITEMVQRADKYVFVSPMWNWEIPRGSKRSSTLSSSSEKRSITQNADRSVC